ARPGHRRTTRGVARVGRVRRRPRVSHRARARRQGVRADVPYGRSDPGARRRSAWSRVGMSVHLVKGADPMLRDRVVDDLVDELLAGDDRSLALEEFTVPGRASGGEDAPAASGAEAREEVVAGVLNAASSPPFMTTKRV